MEHKELECQESSEMAINLLGQMHLVFSRIEAKSSFILGINTGMILFLATKISLIGISEPLMLMALLPVFMIAASMVQLYKCSFPQLKGGRESLISYKEISKMTQERFLTDFTQQTREELTLDLLGQVWHDSVILTGKIHSLKNAYTFCALAVLPWGFTIIIAVTR
ncbi:MAG: Pycsar system effector family protein [Armatimonadota bacterium]